MRNIFKTVAVLLISIATLTGAQTAFAQAHLKKDGTVDKRYKSTAAAPATPTKADGTPDKRYKANKTVTPSPTVTQSTPTKADGTPDKRYKANKVTTPTQTTPTANGTPTRPMAHLTDVIKQISLRLSTHRL